MSGKGTTNEEEDGEVKDGNQTRSQDTSKAASTARDSLPARPSASRDSSKHDSTPSGPRLSGSASGPGAGLNGPKTDSRPANLPDRPPHTLPSRPDVPIPAHYTPERFPQPRGHERRDGKEPRDARSRDSRDGRDSREPRDARESRDQQTVRETRDSRNFDPAWQDRPRDLNGRRAQEHGREQARPDSSSRRNEHERERPRDSRSGRGHDHGRLTESPAPGPVALNATADAPEPHINPERAALLAKDTDRPRVPESDRPGRSRKNAPTEPSTTLNPERAALIENRDSTPSRPPKEDGRGRDTRGQSPRRGGRHGQEGTAAENGRDDRQDRQFTQDHRPSGRDPRERSPLPATYRGERPMDRENDRTAANKARDAPGFHGPAPHGPESDYKAPHQDHSYGRLQPIQSVTDIPFGPRGRGRGAARGGHGTPQNLPGRLDNRFAGNDTERPPTPDRPPPTGPSSGRGRRGGYEQSNTGPATPSGTPSGPQERTRNAGHGQGMPSPAPANATPTGVHPERLAQMNKTLPPPPPPGPPPAHHGHGRQPMPNPAAHTPDRGSGNGPRQMPTSYSGSPAGDLNVPTGPASTNERSRNGGSRRQLAGINSTLQANMPEPHRSSSGRRNQPRQMLGNSDVQVLTGGSPISTPSQERQDPLRHEALNRAPANANGEEASGRGESERGRRDREGRSTRPSRRGSRERDRERSLGREREGKEHREYRDRRSGVGEGGREERDSRRANRDQSSSTREPMGPPSSTGRDAAAGRESRHRGDGQGGRTGEDWANNRSQRGGFRDGGSRSEERREGREDRGRKRRSEEGVGGLSSEREKRPRR